jgi:hypothetical protein
MNWFTDWLRNKEPELAPEVYPPGFGAKTLVEQALTNEALREYVTTGTLFTHVVYQYSSTVELCPVCGEHECLSSTHIGGSTSEQAIGNGSLTPIEGAKRTPD